MSRVIAIDLWLGNLIGIGGTVLGTLSLLAMSSGQNSLDNGIMLGISWMSLWYFPHCLIHYVIGTIVGVKFKGYWLGKSSIRYLPHRILKTIGGLVPVLIIRIDHDHFLSSPRWGRVLMHTGGAVTSMTLPLIVSVVSFTKVDLIFAASAFSAALVNIAFTAYFSSKVGDIGRATAILRQRNIL